MPDNISLASLEVLRAFKRRMPKKYPDANISPFDNRISITDAADADVPEIHSEVRTRIQEVIEDVRTGRKTSQVILLAGDPGTGKTHLLKTFRSGNAGGETGHVFVGGSNHWHIGEFQPRLLDWTIEALTAPSPNETHPLLERIRAIGFRAVEQMLANPVSWKTCLRKTGGKFFGRILNRWKRPSSEKLLALVSERNPAVFSFFDDAAFGQYVCDRFLAERSNLFHRYALRIMLTYLFPDSPETGIGTRERVLHWFRGRGDDNYFTARLGAAERPDRAYDQFESVKLFAHLFSPAVSSQLSTESAPCPSKVFLLTFDQAEGRNELFEDDGHWKKFFAHLSELYNTLPNVVVLFTMTLPLRDRLHPSMERQFRDRIRMDSGFTLLLPQPREIRSLYRSRIESWLASDTELLQTYLDQSNPYLPLNEEGLDAVAGIGSVRQTLVQFDKAFHAAISTLVVDPQIDYLYARNALEPTERSESEWDYTNDHLGTVNGLLESVGRSLTDRYGFNQVKIETATTAENLSCLRFQFQNLNAKIVVTLARLSRNYKLQIEPLVNLALYNREKTKNFLALVRNKPIADNSIPPQYTSRVVRGLCPVEIETSFCALRGVALKRAEYSDRDQTAAFEQLLFAEIDPSWLGEMLRFARSKLDDLSGTSAADSAVLPVPTTESI